MQTGKFLLETDTQWVCRKGKKSLRSNFHQDERCWYCWQRSFPKREKDFQMRPLLVPSRWLSIVRHNGGHQHWGWLEKRGRKKSRKNESIATERGIVLNREWDRKKWQKAKSIGAIYRESGRPCVHVCHPITLVMADSLFFCETTYHHFDIESDKSYKIPTLSKMQAEKSILGLELVRDKIGPLQKEVLTCFGFGLPGISIQNQSKKVPNKWCWQIYELK